MATEQIAIISDVHGNLTALEAVLADIAARGIERIVNLGDDAGKGPRGSAVVDRLAAVCEADVRGNWDDFLPQTADDGAPEMVWWRDELRPAQRERIAAKPLCHDLLLSGRRIRLFHASATSVHVRVHVDHTREEFDGMFAATELTGPGPEPVMVGYGDVHAAYQRTRRGRTLFNTGSVGNPLDEPTPAYAILEGDPDADGPAPFGLQHVRVPYDVDAELAVARDVGMPQYDAWERELRTGVYRQLAL
ncbi:metallophosphatase family protein [Isoptericola sp. S6320L]|uniref:metallophosphoesterase family protein n=1 Tax=Isoptericola sp. S6320L TaxID=2926411 RepID=UPI001FF49529|nr:metallophosphoesterase family protein [Isoptericola sp. S6320L]MCK0117457.1 metallophosphatase family protein [Isoptericola sp. S6320L]